MLRAMTIHDKNVDQNTIHAVQWGCFVEKESAHEF